MDGVCSTLGGFGARVLHGRILGRLCVRGSGRLGGRPPQQARRTRSRQVRGSVHALSANMFSIGLVSAGSVGNVRKQGKTSC